MRALNKVGFIGLGNMGRMLIEGFINSDKLKSDEIVVSTRTRSKLKILNECYPEIEISDNKSLAEKCNYIFICVKPRDVRAVLDEIKQWVSCDVHVISVAACVTIENIKKIIDCKISKVIPSITSEIGEGFSLVCHSPNVLKADAEYIESIFASISTVKVIDEKNFEVGADLTSCAPGFFSAVISYFIEAGVKNSNFSRDEIENMVIKTFFATSKMLSEKNISAEELICRVATRGGITEEGVKIMDNYLPDVFDQVFKKTLQKHEAIKDILTKQYEM